MCRECENTYELPPRAATGLDAAARLAGRLRGQGFGVTRRFAAQFARRAASGGRAFDTRGFRRAFHGARHLRPARPGARLRVAIVRGLPVVYRRGGPDGRRIVLVGLLPAGARPRLVPALPPREGEADYWLTPAILSPRQQQVTTGRVPRFTVGEIKGLRSWTRGAYQLSGRNAGRGNDALFVYDDKGNVHGTVFKQDPITKVRVPIWEGTLGRVAIPRGTQPGSARRGNLIEDRIRRLIQRRTGQRYQKKHPSARGPDLTPRKRKR